MDYATLKFVWWLLVGALLIGFAITDGHDMGVGISSVAVCRQDRHRTQGDDQQHRPALGRQSGLVRNRWRCNFRRMAVCLCDSVFRLLFRHDGSAVGAFFRPVG